MKGPVKGLMRGIEGWAGQGCRELQGMWLGSGLGKGVVLAVTRQEVWLHRGQKTDKVF